LLDFGFPDFGLGFRSGRFGVTLFWVADRLCARREALLLSGAGLPSGDIPCALSSACERVGRWLYHFSQIERCLGEGIQRLFHLQGVPAEIVTSGLDISRKINTVYTIANVYKGEPTAENKKLFNSIRAINDDGQILAHSAFEPATAEAVRFRRSTAKGEFRTNLSEWTWTAAPFNSGYEKMSRINDDLQALINRLAAR
jgi:hypothetical protein